MSGTMESTARTDGVEVSMIINMFGYKATEKPSVEQGVPKEMLDQFLLTDR